MSLKRLEGILHVFLIPEIRSLSIHNFLYKSLISSIEVLDLWVATPFGV